MKKFRRLMGTLSMVMAVGIIGAFSAEECLASSPGSGNLVQMVSKTRLDVSKGDIKIGPYEISGISPEGKQETQANSEGYHITGETSTYSITIEEGVSTEILLENVNISQVDTDACALLIEETSRGNVTVVLRGYNVLKSGSHCAGLQKSCNQTSCVRSKSSCSCGTLTIQCEKYQEGHVCDENCGTLIASGVNGGAGIGGGDGRKTNRIRIRGGHIAASGGYGGAGIGGGYFCDGSNVEITGGEVTAVAGEGNVALGGLDGSENNLINGDCIVDAGSMGGLETRRGILLNGNSGAIHGVVHITRNGAMGILKDKTLTREEGGRLVLPEGVFVTTQNTLRTVSADSASENSGQKAETTVSANQSESGNQSGTASPGAEQEETESGAPSAKGIYGQTLEQLETVDQPVEGGIAGTWSWAEEEHPDKTYPIVDGTTSYTRVFKPEDSGQKEVRVKIIPEISYLETSEKAKILSPASPDGENGWYKGNVVLEAPDGYQIFHSRSVGWVEELVVEDDKGSGDYEYYLREVGTNLTTGVKTIRLNIDSRPPEVESATVTYVEGSTRIRVKGSEDTALTEQVSGMGRFYCLVVPQENARVMSAKAVVKNKYTKDNTAGEFTYTDISRGTRCELYVVAADKAGNLSEVSTQTFTAQ